MNGCDSWSLASHFGLRDHRGDSLTDPSPDPVLKSDLSRLFKDGHKTS